MVLMAPLTVIPRGVLVTLPAQLPKMPQLNPKGLSGSIKITSADSGWRVLFPSVAQWPGAAEFSRCGDMRGVFRKIAVCGSISLVLCAQGCGTIITLSNCEKEGTLHGLVYGGVGFDYRGAFDDQYMQHALFLKPVCVLDMPLSALTDTVALPYTIIKRRYAGPSPKSPPP